MPTSQGNTRCNCCALPILDKVSMIDNIIRCFIVELCCDEDQ